MDICISETFPVNRFIKDQSSLWLPAGKNKNPSAAARFICKFYNSMSPESRTLDVEKIPPSKPINITYQDIKEGTVQRKIHDVLEHYVEGTVSLYGKEINPYDIERCHDAAYNMSNKAFFYDFCKSAFNGQYNTDKQYRVYKSKYDVLSQWDNIPNIFPGQSFVLKIPAKGGTGVRIFDNLNQWDQFRQEFISVGFPKYYELDLEDTLIAPDIVIEPKIEFTHRMAASFTIQDKNQDRNIHISFEDIKDGSHNGNYTIPDLSTGLRNEVEGIVDTIQEFLAELGYSGEVNVDFFTDLQSILNITECNVRVGGSAHNHYIYDEDLPYVTRSVHSILQTEEQHRNLLEDLIANRSDKGIEIKPISSTDSRYLYFMYVGINNKHFERTEATNYQNVVNRHVVVNEQLIREKNIGGR